MKVTRETTGEYKVTANGNTYFVCKRSAGWAIFTGSISNENNWGDNAATKKEALEWIKEIN